MAQFFEEAVMTNAGAALLARSLAEGIAINFVALAVGDGSYTNTEKSVAALRQRTALKHLQIEYAPASVVRDSSNAVRLSALITNVDPETHETIVEAGFYINEIGIMAEPSDHATDPILFSVSVTTGTRGDYMPAYTGNNPAQIVQGYVTAVSNQAQVTLTAPVNAYALATDLQALSDSVDTRIEEIAEDMGKVVLVTRAEYDALPNTKLTDNKIYVITDEGDSYIIDSALSDTSVNPVQNKVIKAALDGKAPSSHNHSANDITSGTLSIARGGTGKTSLVSTSYTSLEYRGESLNSSTTTPASNGCIAWQYQ